MINVRNICRCITAHTELLNVILFTDESPLPGMKNSRNMHQYSHENSHETRVTNFQWRYSVYVFCGVFANSLIEPFVLQNNLTEYTYEAFLMNDLPGFWKT